MMAGFPVPYSSGLALSKIDRQVARAMAQIDAAAAAASHRDRAQIDRIAGTTEHGMFRAAQLGALEGALIQSSPLSAGYVHTVAVGGVWGIAAAINQGGRGS
jgi:hypothetical protein